ncbi:MAG: glutathione S-transferase family protein [Pseudomonadota bacterium]
MNQEAITVYAWSHASRAERCIWTLNETGLEHEVVRLKPRPDTPEYAKLKSINPAAKIPTVTHGDRVLTESVPTCEYLARLKPQARLLPETDAESHEYGVLMHYLLTEVEGYLWTATQASTLSAMYAWPEGTTEFAVKMTQKGFRNLTHHVGTDYACCGRFTIADILLAQLASWAAGFKLELPDNVAALTASSFARDTLPDTMKRR